VIVTKTVPSNLYFGEMFGLVSLTSFEPIYYG